MDTSKQYIKMCEKAKLGFVVDDYCSFFAYLPPYRCQCGKYVGERYKELVCDKCGHRVGQSLWLLRQDQLQEMYLNSMPDGTYTKIFTLVEAFYGHFEQYGYPSYAFSMEQLWLAFVMKEKYGKIWDGEDWVLQRQEVKAE